MSFCEGSRERSITSVDRLLKMFSSRRITRDEFDDNMFQAIFAAEEPCWLELLDMIPAEMIPGLYEYVEEELRSGDFCPEGHLFLITCDEGGVRERKKELRPRFVRFHNMFQDYVGREPSADN